MLKLKKIISQLKAEEVGVIENELVKNKAQNFLFLFQSYRENKLSDTGIMEKLELKSNAFYVLKSRLHEKVQQHLTGNKDVDKTEVLRQLSNISQYCFETPRETAVSILLKLEKDLKASDLPADLTVVYSTLKKLHMHSQKYYQYCQLYNKHIAYAIVLEKAEDLLGNFCKTLSDYFFSRSADKKEHLILLKREIDNIYALNNAHRIEFIKNIITIQYYLFSEIDFEDEAPIEDLLQNCEAITKKFPNDTNYSYFNTILRFLSFEYYKKIGQMKKAMPHFQAVDQNLTTWLLSGNSCLAYKFLLSKLDVALRTGDMEKLEEENAERELLYDKEDVHTDIIVKLYKATCSYYTGKAKKSVGLLNDALNELSTRDALHMEMELKSTLAWFYYTQKEYEMCSNLLRSMYRKINSIGPDVYENVLQLSKLMNLLINDGESDSAKQKISKTFKLFEFHNSGPYRIMEFVLPELEKLKT